MFVTLKKNIWCIAIIFLFSLPLLRFFGAFKKGFQRKLYKKAGIIVNFYFTSISFSTIFLGKAYFRTKTHSIVLQNIELKFSLKKVVLGRNREVLNALNVSDIKFIFHRRDKNSVKKNRQPEPDSNKYAWEKKFYPIFKKALDTLFTTLQTNIEINTLQILLHHESMPILLKANQLIKKKNEINCNIQLSLYDLLLAISFNAKIDPISRVVSIKQVEKNLIQNNDQQLVMVDNFYFDFFIHNDTDFECKGLMNNILLHHDKIAQNPVEVEYIDFEVPFTFSKEKFFVSNESNIDFNGIEFSLDIQHDCREADLLKISILFLLNGETFFQSYPFFIIKELENFRAEGRVILKLDYLASFSDFSSYYFKASTIENTFKLVNTTSYDLSFLNSEFVYPYKVNHSNFTRTIHLSSSNSFYLPLSNIPAVLAELFIITEDPHFYYHNGIHDYAIGLAIALNIKYGKFKRGGSTIAMQLVRNLFLHHSKTITRKLEELLLAWLMMNHFYIPRERILEIYLNIIEFGENVYGVAEAAKFYFDKKVNDLDLTECLVLSYVIPRPKFFLEAVQINSPQLVLNLSNHIHFYGSRLLENNSISVAEFENIRYEICFRTGMGMLKLEKTEGIDENETGL